MIDREIFTDEAMTRPLFQEPTEDIERPDPWTGPKGFMFGGMSHATKASLAEEYFEAANLIIDAIKRNEIEDYKLANAALFLYRHSCELILKAALGGKAKRTHNLLDLTFKFAERIKADYGEEVPAWIMTRMKELAAIDPGSMAFRYGNYESPIDGNGTPIGFEAYVDLYHLQAAMKALNTALVSVVSEIAMSRGWRP